MNRTCSWTSGASLCKHLESLKLPQPVIFSELSVLQLADRLHPTLTLPSVIATLWLENFHFSCHRSRQMLHLPGCFCFRQLCFHILEFGGFFHMQSYHSLKIKKSKTFWCLFSLVCICSWSHVSHVTHSCWLMEFSFECPNLRVTGSAV